MLLSYAIHAKTIALLQGKCAVGAGYVRERYGSRFTSLPKYRGRGPLLQSLGNLSPLIEAFFSLDLTDYE